VGTPPQKAGPADTPGCADNTLTITGVDRTLLLNTWADGRQAS